MKLLSIQIPTIVGREKQLQSLMNFINSQVVDCGCSNIVEVVSYCDNKELTIGEKRQRMYENSNGWFSVQIDDDDTVAQHYINSVINNMLNADLTDVDCITYKEKCHMTINRRFSIKFVNHSMKYGKWMNNYDGYDYVRTPFCKDIIKTELAVKAGVPFIRYNEDEQFSVRLLPLLKNEIHIDDYLYIYQYSNAIPHQIKYGLKK